MAIRITPDSQLASSVAIETRIAQLEEEIKRTAQTSDPRQLHARIRALQARLAAGKPEHTAVHPNLLISKKDLEGGFNAR